MSTPPNAPWYHRPIPGWLPPWLVIALVVAITCGSCAVYLSGYSAGTVAIVFGLGFVAGLVLSLAVSGWPGRAPSPEASRFRPPAWLATPVGVAVLVLFAHGLIDETLRQGYYDGYRRRRGYYQLPGPLAVVIGCCCLTAAALLGLGGVRGRPRTASRFVGGLLGLAVLFVGLCEILTRVWSHFAGPAQA